MRHPLVGNGRRNDRHRELCSEDGRDRRHVADVDEHARPEPPAIESLDVASDRVLVAGAACEVAERRLVQFLLSQVFVVPDVEWLHVAELRAAPAKPVRPLLVGTG
jgi:hypothetical protein